MKTRDMSLDLMRLIGVLIIMLAHSSPPDWLFQLRNFGTPLLIVASALTYSVIYQNKTIETIAFIKKRLYRLFFPAWFFLIFFFTFFFVVFSLTGDNFPFSLRKVANSFLFYKGIGFVWIFKVYIMLALMTPFALSLKSKIKSNNLYFGGLIILLLCYEFFYYTVSPLIPSFSASFFDNVVFVVFPYLILYFYGLKLQSLSNKSILSVSLFSLLLFFLLATFLYQTTGSFVPTQEFKYPPRIYYLSYAFFALNLIYLLCRSTKELYANSKMITWLSANSLWIYLWHIMAYYVWQFYVPFSSNNLITCLFKTVFLLCFGIVATKIQTKLVSRFLTGNDVGFYHRLSFILS